MDRKTLMLSVLDILLKESNQQLSQTRKILEARNSFVTQKTLLSELKLKTKTCINSNLLVLAKGISEEQDIKDDSLAFLQIMFKEISQKHLDNNVFMYRIKRIKKNNKEIVDLIKEKLGTEFSVLRI